MNQLFEDLLTHIQDSYTEIIVFLPKLIAGLLIFTLFWFLSKRVQKSLSKSLIKRMDDPLLANFIAQMAKVALIIVGFMILLRTIGLEGAATSILATAGVSAFIIGFAFKDIGENFLAGIVMAFNRPFKVGDVVETNGIVGKIINLTLRDTEVKTFDGKDVHIPNAQILKQPLFNYTIDGFLRFDFQLGIDYYEDIQKATEIILREVRQITGILGGDKGPNVDISEFSSSKIMLKVYFWINTFDKTVSTFDIKRKAINNCIMALRKEGINLPRNVVQLVTNGEGISPGLNQHSDQ